MEERRFDRFASVGDFERSARAILPKATVGYICGGSADEETLARNQRALKQLLIRPFTLRNVGRLDTTVRLQLRVPGKSRTALLELPFPLAIAPTGFQCLAHPDGERATVKAAGETGMLMISSSFATTSLEEIAASAPRGSNLWFQVSICKDRGLTKSLAERAIAAGYQALVVTGDPITEGRIRNNVRNGFLLPAHLKASNFEEYFLQHKAESNSGKTDEKGMTDLRQFAISQLDDSMTWEYLEWLIGISPVPVIIKGVMRPEDAEKALAVGVAGIICSNLGGRSLDSAPSTIEALAELSAVVKGRCPLFMDGGIRSGTDIFKAIALGAQAVFIGRPVVYGLAVGGKEGVKRVIELLRREFENTMKLSGCATLAQLRESRSRMIVHESYYRSKF